MNHRHLLPDEIDLLIDDEVGFGVGPLKAHVRDCTDCRARVEEARVVVNALERAVHFAPSHNFADDVMSQVPVFVPWHVAARDTVEAWLPKSRPALVAAAAAMMSVASVLTVGLLWVASQTDLAVFAGGMVGGRLKELVSSVGHDVIATVFGDQVFAVVQQTGPIGIAVALLGFAAAGAGSIAGLHAIAVASGRRRS